VRAAGFIPIYLIGFALGYTHLAIAETKPLIRKSPDQRREHVITMLKEFVFRHQTFSQVEIVMDLLEKTKTDVYLLEAFTRSNDANVHEEFRTLLPDFSKEEILILESRRLKSIENCDDNVYYLVHGALSDPDETFQKSWKNWLDNPLDALMKGVVFGTYGAIDSVALFYTVPRWLYTCHDE
jgi:hypothetical protein